MAEQRRCDTCCKKKGEDSCQVLTEMIGKMRDCFAWTDDPEWYEKYLKSTRKYAGHIK